MILVMQEKIAGAVEMLLDRLEIGPGCLGVVAAPGQEELISLLEQQGYKIVALEEETIAAGTKPCDAYVVGSLPGLQHSSEVLDRLTEMATRDGVPILLCALNFAHNGNLLRLFGGQEQGAEFGGVLERQVPYTEARLARVAEAAKLSLIEKMDVVFEAAADEDCLLLQKRVLAGSYLAWLRAQMDPAAEVYAFVRAYTPAGFVAPLGAGMKKENRPFLSVVMRTQGKRTPILRDTLQSLQTQEDGDFEVLLVGHKVSDTDKRELLLVLESLSAELREKIEYVEVDTGNRSTPLNRGFQLARGEYIAALDDDDYVKPNWVAAFRRGAQKAQGTILRAYCETQQWDIDPQTEALFPAEEAQPRYCEPFNYVQQLVENQCPLLSLAFPAEAVRQLRYSFNEKLNTVEDWDYLMYLVYILGVTDTGEKTCVYRHWKGAESSATLHRQEEWGEDFAVVKAALNKRPVILPVGGTRDLANYYHTNLIQKNALEDERRLYSAQRHEEHERFNATIAELQEKNARWEAQEAQRREKFQHEATLYLDIGGGFSEEAVCRCENALKYPSYRYEYSLDGAVPRSFRFDPSEKKEVVIERFSLKLVLENGEEVLLPRDALKTNGFFEGEFLIFLHEDPWVVFQAPNGTGVRRVCAEGNYVEELPFAVKEALWSRICVRSNKPSRFWRRLFR